MTDMQTSLTLLIVRPSILNPVMHFSTQPLTGEMKCPTSHTFALRILFHLPNIDATQAPNSIKSFDHHHESTLGLIFLKWYDPLHIITWPLWSIDLDLASVHRYQVLLKLHRHTVPRFKALTCPSPLQPIHQAKSCLDLLYFGHMTQCHVSYEMSSSITLYEHSINP